MDYTHPMLTATAFSRAADRLLEFESPIFSACNSILNGFSAMASNHKLPRLLKRIGTHSGVFHCDEALAIYMLKQLPEYSEAEVVRTRDSELLDTCDIIVDVGGEYDPKALRFDHHQRSFDLTLSSIRPELVRSKEIKLSSAGLIYAHFGLEVIGELLAKHKHTPTTSCLQHIYGEIYDTFVEEMDAIDNGIPMYPEGKPRYRIGTHLSARVHNLNPKWNATGKENVDELFGKAVDLVGKEFTDKVLDTFLTWWPAREVVKKAIECRFEVCRTGEIVELRERCSWKDHLLSLEDEMGISGEIKFVIFHDATDSWRVQGIPQQPDSFVCRVFLHKDWRGVRDNELSKIAGIEGCIFCHATGFIGGNKTREGALQMALRSLESARDNGNFLDKSE